MQREVELSPPEPSIMEKKPKQQYFEIWIIPFNIIEKYHSRRLKSAKTAIKLAENSTPLH